MLLGDLLSCPAATIEALSDKELTELLAPKFQVTRPEFAVKHNKPGINVPTKTKEILEKEAKKKKAMEIAKKMGIELNL